MSSDEFRAIVADMRERWPKMPMGPTVAADWQAAIGEFEAAEVRIALRGHAINSRFIPRPGEIREAVLAERGDRGDGDGTIQRARWPGDELVIEELERRDPAMLEEERRTGQIQHPMLRDHPGNAEPDPRGWDRVMLWWVWQRVRDRIGEDVPGQRVPGERQGLGRRFPAERPRTGEELTRTCGPLLARVERSMRPDGPGRRTADPVAAVLEAAQRAEGGQ